MYAEPRTVTDPSKCYFYHKIDLPTGTVGGDWDHRDDIENYLGRFNYAGKRVLDMGTATGLLSFEMEKRGAEVVSFDIGDGKNWDLVPHFKNRDGRATRLAQIQDHIERMKNGYWYCHRALNSKNKVYYGNIYDMPDELGTFDVAMYGLILTHLRDPVNALINGAKLVRDTMIVTGMYRTNADGPAYFRPSLEESDTDWWMLSTSTVERMLGMLGFKVAEMIESKATLNVRADAGPRILQTMIAKRVY